MKSKFNSLFNLIIQQLTAQQKQLTDKYTKKRKKTLSYGPLFKNERTYFPLNNAQNIKILIPPENLVTALDDVGFYISDYRAGTAMKKSIPGQKKDLRQIKIGKILNRLNKPELIKQFNERLGTSKKDIKNLKLQLCITYNPYDIAGMSTDRNWTSCMNLNGGAYYKTAYRQVQYGGMCAYLINETDKEIKQPYARIAIKRMIGQQNKNSFVFVSEHTVYGNADLAKEFEMDKTLEKILNQSNQKTKYNEYLFNIADKYSYSDNDYKKFIDYNNIKNYNLSDKQIKYILVYSKLSNTDLNNLIKKYNLVQKKYWNLISLHQPLTNDFIKQHINLLNLTYLCENKYIDTNKFANEFYQKFTKDQFVLIFNSYLSMNKKVPLKIVKAFLSKSNELAAYQLKPLLQTNSISVELLQEYMDNYGGGNYSGYQLKAICEDIAQYYKNLPWEFIKKYINQLSYSMTFLIINNKFNNEQFKFLLDHMTEMLCYNITRNYNENIFKNLTIEQKFDILFKAQKVYHNIGEDNLFNRKKEKIYLDS